MHKIAIMASVNDTFCRLKRTGRIKAGDGFFLVEARVLSGSEDTSSIFQNLTKAFCTKMRYFEKKFYCAIFTETQFFVCVPK